MAHRPLVLTLAAGAALTAGLGCTGSKNNAVETGQTGGGGDTVVISENPPPPPPPMPEPDTTNPPSPGVGEPGGLPERPITANPPPPGSRDVRVRESIRAKNPKLPEWASVKSGHPEGATNPPSPVLVVTPDGTCFKRWEGGMIPSAGDRVEIVTADGSTTEIQCPEERALKVYEDWVAKGRPDPTKTGLPPEY